MAIIQRIKLGVMDAEIGQIVCPDPTQGRVRGLIVLWAENPAIPGSTVTRSDKFLVIGDDIGPTSGPVAQRYGQPLTAGDAQLMQNGAGQPGRKGWEQLLTDRGISLDDYIATNRNFYLDLGVPASVIAAYTG